MAKAKQPKAARLPAPSELAGLSAATAAGWIAEHRISAEELVTACLERIDAVDANISAWAQLDQDYALSQARESDRLRREGRNLGPLAGVPVGIKDIIDTGDLPTECGSVLCAGRRPLRDAAVVARLRAAGAIILGKTVTTEFALLEPGKTRNPYDASRTPGGSSSGSAAAVAASMVPLALGTQTNGSVIRPAAFCGVYGLKPSFGSIGRGGMLMLSRALDQPGLFARSLDDIALLGDVVIGHDAGDPDSRPTAAPDLVRLLASAPPVTPRIAVVRSPVWDKAEPDTRDAFAELEAALGKHAVAVDLPALFEQVAGWHKIVFEAGIAFNLAREYAQGRDKLSAGLRTIIENGQKHPALAYQQALAMIPCIGAALDAIFDEYDAIVTPAAPGEAPAIATTGSPIFSTIWTFAGAPALTLPLMRGSHGLPLGVQMIGQRGRDGRLLRTARWLEKKLAR
ncbi:MAG: amidase [Alphaproteobacteria bacterium]|nr:amidase [Alphaproteobacteria bacterium]